MPLPPGQNLIRNRWVLKLKRDGDGTVKRYKPRLVAKGYTQREEVDYDEIYAPVVKLDSLRVILALAADLDLDILQMDIKTAFLYGDLPEELYMAQPDGVVDPSNEKLVCRLNLV